MNQRIAAETGDPFAIAADLTRYHDLCVFGLHGLLEHGVVETDAAGGDPARELIPYALAWQADLVVAGNSATSLLLRRLFGRTALRLVRESPLPLYPAQ